MELRYAGAQRRSHRVTKRSGCQKQQGKSRRNRSLSSPARFSVVTYHAAMAMGESESESSHANAGIETGMPAVSRIELVG